MRAATPPIAPQSAPASAGPDKCTSSDTVVKLGQLIEAAVALAKLDSESPDGLVQALQPGVLEDNQADGFCYLLLFHPHVREVARTTLGAFPDVASLRRFANSRAAPWASSGVRALSRKQADGVIWHVVSGSTSASVILAMMDKEARVGAAEVMDVRKGPDIVTAVHPTAASGLLRTSDGMTLRIPVRASMEAGQAVRFDPSTSTFLKQLFGPYESVELNKAAFTVHVLGDNSALFYGAVTRRDNVASVSFDSAVGATYYVYTTGSSDTSVTAKLEMPVGHPFGRQIKGLNLGNVGPVFCFGLRADGQARALVSGQLEVHVSGSGVMDAVVLNAATVPT